MQYSIRRSERYPIELALINADEGEPIDLTGAKIRYALKDEVKDDYYIINRTVDENTDIITDGGKITDATNGKVIIRFSEDDFKLLVDERIYYLSIWWEVPSEDFIKVVSSNCGEYLEFKVCAI